MSKVDSFRKMLTERARIQLLALTDPEPNKLIDRSLLRGLIPIGWMEKVYEYENKFHIHLTIEETVSKKEEMSLMTLIRKEFGDENVICTMAENTPVSSSIRVQLKKSNYEEEVLV